MPRAKLIEQELTRKLLISQDLYWRFNARSLYAYDLSEITSTCKEMTEHAAMTRNEWRDWIGMSPRDNMEEIFMLENFLPQNQIGLQKKIVGNDEKKAAEPNDTTEEGDANAE